MENELKPCPFCGGRALVKQWNAEQWCVSHFCRAFNEYAFRAKQGQEFLIIRSKKQAAIDTWTRRASDGTAK